MFRFFLSTSLLATLLHLSHNTFAQSWQWAENATGNTEVLGNGIAVSPDNSVYVTGTYYDTLVYKNDTAYEFITGALPEPDCYIISTGINGDKRWLKTWGGEGYDEAVAIALDIDDNVYAVGSYATNMILDGDTLLGYDASGAGDIYLAKLDSTGNGLWLKRAIGPDESKAEDVLTYGNYVYVSGLFTDSAIFDTISVAGTGTKSFFLAKYNGDGDIIWVRSSNGDYFNNSSITADKDGNIYVTGNFFNTFSLSTDTLNSNGFGDIFIARYSASGDLQWSGSIGGKYADFSRDIIWTDDNSLYITGAITDTAWFGNQYVVAGQTPDIFLAKYDTAGALAWVKFWTGEGENFGTALGSDPSSNIYLAGIFKDTLFLNPFILQSPVSPNSLFAKAASDGTIKWAKHIRSDFYNIANALALDSTSNAFLTGDFTKEIYFDTIMLTGWDSSGGASPLNAWIAMSSCYVPKPSVLIDGNTTFCSGDSIFLYLSTTAQDYSYLWSNGTPDTSIYVNGAGDYYVTAYDNNGCSVSSDTIEVSVFSAFPAAILELDCDSLHAYPGLNQYQWYLNDTLLAAGGAPYIIIENSGKYYMLGIDGNGCIVLSDTIDVFTSRKLSGINVFPNPAAGEISISVPRSNSASLTVEIHSVYGQQTAKSFPVETGFEKNNKTRCMHENDSFTIPLDLSGYKPGIYLIVIRGEKVKWTYKIVKMI